MARLEELTPGAVVKGILPDATVAVVAIKWFGSGASAVLEVTYKDNTGRTNAELVFRDREPTLEIASVGRPWSFDAEGALLRVSSQYFGAERGLTSFETL